MCFFLCSTTSNISRVQVLAASKPPDGGKFNFFVNCTFSFEIDQVMLNMPKFSKTCHNPLHDDWNKKSIDSRIINLRSHGLTDVLNAYKSLESERGGRPQHIINSCCSCLGTCLNKEQFKQKLEKDLEISLNEKVNYNLINFLLKSCSQI